MNRFVLGSAAAMLAVLSFADAPSITKWDNGATGAFTFMFDDGGISSIDVAMPELKQRGFPATFYIVPSSGNYKARNEENDPKWVNAFTENPEFVPGNHLMQHGSSGTYDGVTNEFKECTDYILTNVPGKDPRLISYGRPGVENWPLTEEEELSICKSLNLVSRPPFEGHGAKVHLSDREAMSALADAAATDGTYEYVVFHGLENTNRAPENAAQDYMWVPYAEFAPFFDDVKVLRDQNKLWVADHISVHKYESERNASVVTSLTTTDGSIAFNVTCTGLDLELYDQPLCVRVPVPAEWPSASYRQGEGEIATVEPVDGVAQIHVLPGAGAVSVWESSAETPEVPVVTEPEVIEPEADIVIPEEQGEVTRDGVLDVSEDLILFVGTNTTYILEEISGAGTLTKRGPGTLKLVMKSKASRTTGTTVVEEGVVEFGRLHQSYELGNRVEIGGAGKSATMRWLYPGTSAVNLFDSNNKGNIIVKDKGVLDLTGNPNDLVGFRPIQLLRVEKGGLADIGGAALEISGSNMDSVWIEGVLRSRPEGRISMQAGYYTVPETAEAGVVWAGSMRIQLKYAEGNRYSRFFISDVADVPVELEIRNTISNWENAQAGLEKRDSGVLRLSGANTYGGDIRSGSTGRTQVLGGTLLADNETGSATGRSRVEVGAGGTFGGTGFIGGFADGDWATSPSLNLTGNGTAAATVRPGSIDSETGAHVFGTLTTGSADQACPTAFNDHSQLAIGVGDRGKVDCLAVNGAVTISGTDTKLSVFADGVDLSKAKGGRYVILSATEGIEGDFTSITTPKPSWKVSKVMNGDLCSALELQVPDNGLTLIVR